MRTSGLTHGDGYTGAGGVYTLTDSVRTALLGQTPVIVGGNIAVWPYMEASEDIFQNEDGAVGMRTEWYVDIEYGS